MLGVRFVNFSYVTMNRRNREWDRW